MRQEKYPIYTKKKKTINLVIVLIGVLAIMLTGFVYASKLQDIESFAYSCITQVHQSALA